MRHTKIHSMEVKDKKPEKGIRVSLVRDAIVLE